MLLPTVVASSNFTGVLSQKVSRPSLSSSLSSPMMWEKVLSLRLALLIFFYRSVRVDLRLLSWALSFYFFSFSMPWSICYAISRLRLVLCLLGLEMDSR